MQQELRSGHEAVCSKDTLGPEGGGFGGGPTSIRERNES